MAGWNEAETFKKRFLGFRVLRWVWGLKFRYKGWGLGDYGLGSLGVMGPGIGVYSVRIMTLGFRQGVRFWDCGPGGFRNERVNV